MINNSNNGYLVLGPVACPKGKGVRGSIENIGSGDIDVYTVPSGRKAIITGSTAYNTAGTTTTLFHQIKVGGTYYRISSNSTVNTITGTNIVLPNIVLEAAEVYAINTSQAGLNLALRIIEFDQSSPLKSPKILTLSNGNNTLYTCPSGKTAMMIASNVEIGDGGASHNYVNNSGAAKTITWNAVPSGGSPGSTNQVSASTSVNDDTRNAVSNGPVSMEPGDFIVINTSAGDATQTAWTNLIEF